MSYQVLARKWRPRNFNEMVGQAHVLRALINALDQQRLHHAYLFTGTRGVGKTTLARILAKSLNCLDGVTSTPCGACDACTAIDEGRFVDLIEVDAASRTKVEDTREILDNVQYAPTQGRYKVYLIDEVHMLSNHSFNALLKTLEEPPPHVKFLLATTDPQKLPATILSRCLQFNLTRMPLDLIEQHLQSILQKEAVDYEFKALRLLSQAADGSMRDALSLLDQSLAYGQGQVQAEDVANMLGYIDSGHVLSLLTAVIQSQAEVLMTTIQQLGERVSDFATVLDAVIATLHQLSVIKLVPNAMDDVAVDKETLNSLAVQTSAEDLQLFYQIAVLGKRDLPYAPDSRTGFEMTLLRMLAFKPVDEAMPTPPASAPVGRVATAASVVASEPAQSEPSAMAASSVPAGLALSMENWPDIVKQLKINGAASQLAANAALESVHTVENGQQLVLSLSEEHATLASYTGRLEKALQDYYKLPVKVELNISQPVADTPAVAERRENQQRLDEARHSIEQDSIVQALQEVFDAKIIQESVSPVNS